MRLFALAIAALLWFPIAAWSAGAAEEPVRREVLGLYDSAFEASPSDTMLHMNVEMPLNHLGFVMRYHDLRAGPPSPEESAGAVAVVTLFTYDVSDPASFLDWLGRTLAPAAGPRFVSLGQFGVPLTGGNLARLAPVLRRIGLRAEPNYVPGTLSSRVLALDRAVIGFESEVDPLPPGHPLVVRSGPQADVALEYETDVLGQPLRSVVVATGPGGGYVANGFALRFDPVLDVKRWTIDPFEFLARALGRPDFPVPDTTTLSGRRIYFSHVDGDGWNNLSLASPDMARPELSGEVMLNRLIAPYPDLPVSVGLVGADVDPELGGGEKAADIARRIFALPQVEVASHTMTHPFFWGFFDPYDRARELALVDAVPHARGVVDELSAALGLPHAHGPSRFVAGSNDLPRAFLRDPFSFETEVGRALALAQGLAPGGKRAALYLWSGDTQPTEAAIRATREAGVRNMNGGDVRFDMHRPSVGYVAPISRTVGRERQIYSVNSNENNYTKLWTDHFYGFRQVRETFERTERPRRLKGANVYYHSYSAERPAALDAVISLLDWARANPVVPIRASRYAAMADGFFSTRIAALGSDRWRVWNRDGADTVRFDAAGERRVDPARSRGVLGQARHEGSLYVALDPAVADAVVALAPRDPAPAPPADTAAALLEGSRWLLRDWRREPCALAFAAEGFGPGEFTFDDLPARPMTVTAREGGRVVAQLALRPEAGRPTSFVLPMAEGGPRPLAVRIACDASAAAGEGART